MFNNIIPADHISSATVILCLLFSKESLIIPIGKYAGVPRIPVLSPISPDKPKSINLISVFLFILSDNSSCTKTIFSSFKSKCTIFFL